MGLLGYMSIEGEVSSLLGYLGSFIELLSSCFMDIFSSLLSYWLLVFCAYYLLIPRMETLSFGKMITHVIIA